MCQHWLQNVLLLIACGPVLKSAGKLGPVTLLAFDWEPPRDNSWVVGKPEVILGLDSLFSCVGLSETDPPPGPLPD